DTCDGSGAKKGTKPETCPYCNGSGQTEVEQDTPFGRIINRRACNHCGGTGQFIKEKCETCHGSGRVKKNVTIKVSIPAGIDEGQQIRIAGKGEQGVNGGPAGDLFVVVHIKSHGLCVREADNIFSEPRVTFTEAAVDVIKEAPTVHYNVRLLMPARS